MPEQESEQKQSRRRKTQAPSNQDLKRVPPHNLDAEEGVLASILLDGTGEVLNACVAAKVREEYFFKPEHQLMYAAMLALFNESKPIDEIVLAEWLDRRGQLARIGGAAEIARIAGRIETFAHFRQWLEIIREKFFSRSIIRTCAETIEQAFENNGAIDQFIENVEERFMGISNDRVGDTVKPASEQVDAAVTIINKMILNKGELMGVPTGFTALDAMMRGLHANEMIVIAGRPGTGKTSIALNIVESAIFGKKPVPTLVFSLEMLAAQLYMRMIASRARVDLSKLSRGFIEKDRLQDINTTAMELKNSPIWIDDTSGLSILEMRAKARRLHQQLSAKGSGLGLIIVDYLQLLRPVDASMPREQMIAEVSRGMKAMSKELLAPVIVLAQLNRESEKEERNPRASDLRESGSIEQDADAIILLSRQNKKNITDEEINKNPNWIIRTELAKQRNGPTGVVNLLFNRSYTRYENYIGGEIE